MGCGAAMAPLGAFIASGVGTGPTLALAALVAFSHLVFQINMGALIVDVYPRRMVATAMAKIAAGSGPAAYFHTDRRFGLQDPDRMISCS